MSPLDPVERAVAIYERRLGRKVGAIATIAGVAGAGVLGALRYEQITTYAYALVTAALAGGMIAGPIADLITRRLVRRRIQREIAREVEGDDDAPLELRQRLRAQTIASASELTSTTWPLAKTAVLSIVSWLWPVALIQGNVLSLVGKALSYLTIHAGPTIGLFALAAHLQGRALMNVKHKRGRSLLSTAAVLAAMLLPAFTTGNGFIAVAATSVAIGLAGMFVMVPATWWMRRRAMRERHALSQMVLPPSTSDSDDVRRLLRSTLEWEACPGALRARALRELAARLGAESIGPDLDRGIASGIVELRLAALELAGQLHHRPRLELLLDACRGATPAQATLIPKLLHRHRGPQVEQALLELLAHEDVGVARAAAESLGLVGSIEVVKHLKAAAARPRLAAITAEAVERIRIRLSVGPGGLSVVDESQIGALSRTPHAAALSLPDP